jgi:hypothetical protein
LLAANSGATIRECPQASWRFPFFAHARRNDRTINALSILMLAKHYTGQDASNLGGPILRAQSENVTARSSGDNYAAGFNRSVALQCGGGNERRYQGSGIPA